MSPELSAHCSCLNLNNPGCAVSLHTKSLQSGVASIASNPLSARDVDTQGAGNPAARAQCFRAEQELDSISNDTNFVEVQGMVGSPRALLRVVCLPVDVNRNFSCELPVYQAVEVGH